MGFRDLMGKMSDAIPNEFSQLNAFSQFLPPPFNLLVQTPAALDRFGETYSNDAGLLDSAVYGGQAFMGAGGDPNKYGTGEKDWVDTLGSIGNIAGMFSGAMGGGNPSSGGMPNIEFADGSGRYLAGNSPLQGQSVDGNFIGDLGAMFGQGGGMTTQMPNFLSPEELQRHNSMQSFDWSNILKMLGSAGTIGSGAEQSQPTSYGMTPRLPVPIAPVMPQATRGEGYYQTWLQKNNLV